VVMLNTQEHNKNTVDLCWSRKKLAELCQPVFEHVRCSRRSVYLIEQKLVKIKVFRNSHLSN
jgi:hypothetical protein